MNTFKITVRDGFLNQEYSGDFEATNEATAIAEAKDFYAVELDTDVENVEIANIVRQ